MRLEWCSISVTLGTHNIKKQERTQQVIPVRRAIPHPDYNHKGFSNDIMLLQVNKSLLNTCSYWEEALMLDLSKSTFSTMFLGFIASSWLQMKIWPDSAEV
ncbi:Granzyme H [Manis pentadactyla]|nr:Granzyme H [Manis pentadactyla]